VGWNLDIEIYEWKMENYESRQKDCWTIEAIPRDSFKYFFSTKSIPIVFERNITQYPNLIPIGSKSTNSPGIKI
jgi:hypothetical protein